MAMLQDYCIDVLGSRIAHSNFWFMDGMKTKDQRDSAALRASELLNTKESKEVNLSAQIYIHLLSQGLFSHISNPPDQIYWGRNGHQ